MRLGMPVPLCMAVKDTRSGVGRGLHGITASNSNTRISATRIPNRIADGHASSNGLSDNLGLNFERLRAAMVQRLQTQGITNDQVLAAMQSHGQTISQPWVVARMIAAVCADEMPKRVLEVGTGCGYQAAVMSKVFAQVHSIERIRALYDMAKERLRALRLTKVRLVHGDGMLGLPNVAPFEAIVVAAAGMRIPQALLAQLAIGGVLIAPEGTSTQRLVRITRTGASSWDRQELEEVRFVPLKAGLQT